MAFIINSFHEQVRSALNGSINFDNLAREVKTIVFTTGNDSNPINPLIFKTGLVNKVIGINVIRLRIASSTGVYPAQLPIVSFSQNNELVTIDNISGLAGDIEYVMVLEVIT